MGTVQPLSNTEMPGHCLDGGQLKDKSILVRYKCHHCSLTLRDAVQIVCGHWLCECCMDTLMMQE